MAKDSGRENDNDETDETYTDTNVESYLIPMPTKKAFECDGECLCDDCGDFLGAEVYNLEDGDSVGHLCKSCAVAMAESVAAEAKVYAREHCKITSPLPRFDPSREYRCTPEQYENGDRESYTRNSHACHCRHECTNYDELIRGLDESNPLDRLRYAIVRSQIEELIEIAGDASYEVAEVDDEESE